MAETPGSVREDSQTERGLLESSESGQDRSVGPVSVHESPAVRPASHSVDGPVLHISSPVAQRTTHVHRLP